MKFKRYGNYIRIENQMTWPLPLSADIFDSMSDESLFMHLKSIHSAYAQMIFDPLKKRQKIVSCLRKALYENPTNGGKS